MDDRLTILLANLEQAEALSPAELDVAQALAPLFQRGRSRAARLFPGLLKAMGSPAIAAPVLDLANFLTREKLVEKHPASETSVELSELLGELVQLLLTLEERPD